MREWTVDGRAVTVYPAAASGRPIVYFNVFADEGEGALRILRERNCPDFTLVTVGRLDWEQDLSPWKAPAAFAGGKGFGGGADRFLKVLSEKVIPRAEAGGTFSWRGIAGYSLAGMFAIYALYRTNLFSRAASASGSFWFPGFREYVLSQELQGLPERVYLSLGEKEGRTKNPYWKTVGERTEEIAAFLRSQGIDTVLERNPGNHHRDTAERSAAGIRWILT